VVDESAADIEKISELVGEHTGEQRIRTDGDLLTCVLVCHEYIPMVALCLYPMPLTSRGCANPVGGALGIKLTCSDHNTKKLALFRDLFAEEGNEGTEAHLEELHKATHGLSGKACRGPRVIEHIYCPITVMKTET